MASPTTTVDMVFDVILVDLLLKQYLGPRSAFSLRRVNKTVKRLADTPNIWTEYIRLWGGRPTSIPWGSEHRSSEFEMFRDLMFLERHIQLVPPVRSRYNEDYVCSVTRLVFRRDALLVEFSVVGDMSLGTLQGPSHSGLFLCEPIGFGTVIASSRPSECLLSADDEEQNYAGFLCYPFSFDAMLGSRLRFQYGIAGYSCPQLAELNPEFCKTHHLEHLATPGVRNRGHTLIHYGRV